MLIVVEHRDFHARLELVFDVETLRRLEILQVDAAEGRLERGDHVDHAVALVGVDLDVEYVDAGEFLEQDGLAFHHRLAGERSDVAEPENRGAVRHHGDEVRARGERRRLGRIGRDRLAGGGDPRRIGKREVLLRGERLGRLDLELPRPRQLVKGERTSTQIRGQVGRHESLP